MPDSEAISASTLLAIIHPNLKCEAIPSNEKGILNLVFKSSYS